MDLVQHLTVLILEHNFYLKTIQIEGKKNEIADSLSHFQMERFHMTEQTPCKKMQILMSNTGSSCTITQARGP